MEKKISPAGPRQAARIIRTVFQSGSRLLSENSLILQIDSLLTSNNSLFR